MDRVSTYGWMLRLYLLYVVQDRAAIVQHDVSLEEQTDVVSTTTESWQIRKGQNTEGAEWRYEIKISTSKSGDSSKSQR